jgi:VWFA-related protein
VRHREIVATLLAAVLIPAAPIAQESETPRDVGLMERATTRLAQLDVTVSGPQGAIRGLGAADFEVRLNDRLVTGLIVDDLCVPAGAHAAVDQGPVAPTQTPSAVRGTNATYLLYFDMPHLTQGGRRGAIDAARAMLPRLLAGGHRAMVVANATDLKTVVPLTGDARAIDAALEKMINDVTLFDTYSATEEKRLAEITKELTINVFRAVSLAKRYASEERFRQERDLRRLSMVLGRLADTDPPKAALYFADSMRQNAGEHYLAFFSDVTLKDSNGQMLSEASAIATDAATAALPLDRVMNEASSFGVRFYTVEGQGITAPTSTILSSQSPSRSGAQSSATFNSQRTRDAQTTLGSLAAETGGRAFLNGVSAARMVSQINDDMSCVYLLSFDPRGFAQDKPLAVSVASKRPKVKTSVRGRLVIQSDESRLTARVLSAFASPEASSGATPLRVGVVPVSYQDGNFKARVQVAVPGSAVPSATWDLGASVVSQGEVWQDGAGRVELRQPGYPAVYERDMEFSSGEYEIVAVAHEVTTDTLVSREARGRWPDPDRDPACVAPLAVSQQARGGFLRNGTSLTQGALVIAADEPLRANVPTAVIALVCRAKDQKKPLRVVRTLVGETETPVGSTELPPTGERCGQIVDMIPAKMLGTGSYRFVVSVQSEGAELARSERVLEVPSGASGS